MNFNKNNLNIMSYTLLTECDAIKATLVAEYLQQNEIECTVEEVRNNADSYLGTTGIWQTSKIYVSTDDYDQATELLQQFENNSDSAMTWCPKCGSENLEYGIKVKIPRWITILVYVMTVLFIIVPIVSYIILRKEVFFLIPGVWAIILFVYYFTERNKTGYRCKDCGHTFSHY